MSPMSPSIPSTGTATSGTLHAHILLTLREIGLDGSEKVREWNSIKNSILAVAGRSGPSWALRYPKKRALPRSRRYKAGHLTLEKQREAALKRGDENGRQPSYSRADETFRPHVSRNGTGAGVETRSSAATTGDILERNEDLGAMFAP